MSFPCGAPAPVKLGREGLADVAARNPHSQESRQARSTRNAEGDRPARWAFGIVMRSAASTRSVIGVPSRRPWKSSTREFFILGLDLPWAGPSMGRTMMISTPGFLFRPPRQIAIVAKDDSQLRLGQAPISGTRNLRPRAA